MCRSAKRLNQQPWDVFDSGATAQHMEAFERYVVEKRPEPGRTVAQRCIRPAEPPV